MTSNSASSACNSSDYVSTTAIMSEVKQTIFSKDFKGGKVTSVFGSTELDFTQADITGRCILDISQTFGEVTIIVPADWGIETSVTQFFAAIDYQRTRRSMENAGKVLVIRGTSFFAAIDIIFNT